MTYKIRKLLIYELVKQVQVWREDGKRSFMCNTVCMKVVVGNVQCMVNTLV